MFKIEFTIKNNSSLCNFCLLMLLITTNLLITNVHGAIIRRDIKLDNETTSEIKSDLLLNDNLQLTTTITTEILPKQSQNESTIRESEIEAKNGQDSTTFRTETSYASETKTVTETPITPNSPTPITTIKTNLSYDELSTTVTNLEQLLATTTEIPNIINLQSSKNNKIIKEHLVNHLETTTESPSITTKEITTELSTDQAEITTIKDNLFRDESYTNIDTTTQLPLESVTKISDERKNDYDANEMTTILNQHKFETTTTQQQQQQLPYNERETLSENSLNETNSNGDETEHKIVKLEAKSKKFKTDSSKENIENSLNPSKLDSNDIKIEEGRSHHNNKYDDILAEDESGEKLAEKNNDVKELLKKIPNTGELWSAISMKKTKQKEKLIKLDNTTSAENESKMISSTPSHFNVEQDNTTLKHLTDWSKIMEESTINMDSSTSIKNEPTTTILPDVEKKSQVLFDSISNNINENLDKENSTISKPVPILTELKTNSIPTNGIGITNETLNQAYVNVSTTNSSESFSFDKEKFSSKLNEFTAANDDNQIENNNTKIHQNDNNVIQQNFLKASSVNNNILNLENNNNNNKTIDKISFNDENYLNSVVQTLKNTTTTTDEILESNKTNSSLSNSVTDTPLNKNLTKSSEIITTIPPTIITETTTTTTPTITNFDLTTMRGLPDNQTSLETHPNKEDTIDNMNNTVTLNNTFKNNSSEKYLGNNIQNNSQQLQQPNNEQQLLEEEHKIIILNNSNSNLADKNNNSKHLTAEENSLNETKINSISNDLNINNFINNNNNISSKSVESKEELNKIDVKINESDIKNNIELIITTEKSNMKQEQQEDIEQNMTSRMDYDDMNVTNVTTTELYKNILNETGSTISPSYVESEIIKKVVTTEKIEKTENGGKSTSESSIENDILEKHQPPPTTKSTSYPKPIQQPTTTSIPLKLPNNDEEIVENSLDVHSTLQTIPFGKDLSDIFIGSPSSSLSPSLSDIESSLYPKYEVTTTSDIKFDIINIENSTKMMDGKISDPSSTKVPFNDEGLEGSPNDTDYNVIIAVSVSVVGIIALILLVGFLIVMRKRQKQTTFGQRCRPVGLDAYSLDNISIRDSIRGKSFRSSVSKRTYGNVAFDDPSLVHNMMSIHELNRFIAKKTAIYDEFKDIPQINAKVDEVPPGCEDKNRYANVVPLPETRVILQQQNSDEKTEYINANYVRGPKDSPNYYIACQAPLESTVPDFWRMIWEQNSRVIIMATDLEENGIEKSAAYIPESITLDNHVVFGSFQITLKNREVKDKYAVSTLHVKNIKTNAWREITHFWYQWPVTGVPSDEAPMIAMLLEARSCLKSAASEQIDDEIITENGSNDKNITADSTQTNKRSEENGNLKNEKTNENRPAIEIKKNKTLTKSQGPLLIHCSPGTGRTGTIIACDIAIRSLETPKRTVDIPQIVYYVRRGRASSIQTREQYEYIYRVTHMYATKISAPVNDN